MLRACVGGGGSILLARGVGQFNSGRWDSLRVNGGHVFANTVRYKFL